MELVSGPLLSGHRFIRKQTTTAVRENFFVLLPWPLQICSRCLRSISFFSATATPPGGLQALSALKHRHQHNTWREQCTLLFRAWRTSNPLQTYSGPSFRQQ